ncbi:MAG TPA: hypothetical protein VKW78_11940 [Terriglobales bacterium]|nr:hypothetical protein [Terriglobales bacterium]
MKLVRVLSETPAEAADLISFLENSGYAVETADHCDQDAPPADIEIDLRVLPLETALQVAHELAVGDVDVFISPGVFADVQLQHDEPEAAPAEEVVLEPSFATEAEPHCIHAQLEDNRPLVITQPEPAATPTSVRLRESWSQISREFQLVSTECFSLIGAELVNISERMRQSLQRARILVIRKRALVEARATRTRNLVETRLRFDAGSTNAWLRSAIAGAGLMVLLLLTMLWNERRVSSPVKAAIPIEASSGVETHTAAPATVVQADTVHPLSASLRRHSTSSRADDLADDEVIIRHFKTPLPKPAVAPDAGIKHFSDMN